MIATVRPEIIDWLLGDILGTTQHNTLSILFGEGFWNLPDPLMAITGTGHTVSASAKSALTMAFTA